MTRVVLTIMLWMISPSLHAGNYGSLRLQLIDCPSQNTFWAPMHFDLFHYDTLFGSYSCNASGKVTIPDLPFGPYKVTSHTMFKDFKRHYFITLSTDQPNYTMKVCAREAPRVTKDFDSYFLRRTDFQLTIQGEGSFQYTLDTFDFSYQNEHWIVAWRDKQATIDSAQLLRLKNLEWWLSQLKNTGTCTFQKQYTFTAAHGSKVYRDLQCSWVNLRRELEDIFTK